MILRRLRLAICLIVIVATAAVSTAARATDDIEHRFQYFDLAGDAVGWPSADITSVAYELTRRGPGNELHLVVTMRLAEPPSDLVDYQTGAEAVGCGDFDTAYGPPALLTLAPGTGRSNMYVGCGATSPNPITGTGMNFVTAPEVVGRTITWAVPFDSLPAEMRSGIKLYRFHALTQFAEPVFGHNGTGNVGSGLDRASTGVTWTPAG